MCPEPHQHASAHLIVMAGLPGVGKSTIADVLGQALPAVVLAVNAVEPARHQWRSLARWQGVPLRVIEVVCTDEALHRRRLTQRTRALAPLPEPSWDDVVRRRHEYIAWEADCLVLDTVATLEHSVARALAYVARHCN